jgi:hypothetical protein
MKLCNEIPSNIIKAVEVLSVTTYILFSGRIYVMLQVVNISLLVTEDCDVLSCIILHIVGVNLFM